MSTSYPGSLDSYTPLVDDVDYPQAADINNPRDAIVAIETLLGIGGDITLTAGDIFLAAGYDIYAEDNDLPIFKRLNGMADWDEHFDGLSALPSGWAWAGAPFVTPDVISYGDSGIELGYTVGAARSFLYKAHAGGSEGDYRALISTNINAAGAYFGPRIDDNSDNNYNEGEIYIVGSTSYRVDAAHNLAAAGRTVTNGTTFYHPISDIRCNVYNTKWTNWNINAAITGINTAGDWMIRTATPGVAHNWTPTRQGIVINWLGTGWHRVTIEAWLGAA